jgi:ComF family protein
VVACGVTVWAPVGYAGPARDLVRALKFRGATSLADWMAAQIAASAPPGTFDGEPAPVLVPVPLHPSRLRRRGFNQAALIAAALAERTGLAVHDCLVRAGPPVTQVGRAREARLAGLEGALTVAAAPQRPVLLVDDVVTTGATLAACSGALAAAGSGPVRALAFARTAGR